MRATSISIIWRAIPPVVQITIIAIRIFDVLNRGGFKGATVNDLKQLLAHATQIEALPFCVVVVVILHDFADPCVVSFFLVQMYEYATKANGDNDGDDLRNERAERASVREAACAGLCVGVRALDAALDAYRC